MTSCLPLLYVGSQPSRRIVTFDEEGNPADPGTITVRVVSPSGVVTEYVTPDATISQESTGVWIFQFPAPLTEDGNWWLHITASGGGTDVATDHLIKVKASHVPAA